MVWRVLLEIRQEGLYNAAAVRGDLALKAAGMAVPVRIWEYAERL